MDVGALSAGFVTGLREGVEAALIVAILIAYLVRSGHDAEVGKIWAGTGLAVLVSLAAGSVILATAGALEAPYEQYFEAAALLVAATVVTWMLFWMRRQSMALRSELHARIDKAVGEGATLGLAVLAFTAVIREGLETSIFLVGQATSAQGSSPSLFAGALIGLVGAAGIGWLFYTGSRRVDLRAFFKWTGIALVFIAAGLVSRSIHELVEVGVIPVGTQVAFNLSNVLPTDAGIGQFLRAIFGYSDSPEVATLTVHVVYLVTVLGLYLRPMARRLPPATPAGVPPSTETAAS